MHKAMNGDGGRGLVLVGTVARTDEPEKFIEAIKGMGAQEVSPRTYTESGELLSCIILMNWSSYKVYFNINLLPSQILYTSFKEQMTDLLNTYARQNLH